MNTLKIAVAGIGYVGLTNAVLLAQKNQVHLVDVDPERVDMVNGRRCPFADSINVQAENNIVETVLLNGKRFDCGSVHGYVEAIKNVASNYKFE